MGLQPDRPGTIPAGHQDGKVAVADSCLGADRNFFMDSLYKDAAYFEKAGLHGRYRHNIQSKCGHLALQYDSTRTTEHGRKVVHS